MARERVTPEMDQLMKSMVKRTHEIEADAKRLVTAKDSDESALLRRQIEDGRRWLEEAGSRLRTMRKDLEANKG